MSEWIEIDKADISVDGEDIHILYGSNNNGNLWIEAKVKDVLEVIAEKLSGVKTDE